MKKQKIFSSWGKKQTNKQKKKITCFYRLNTHKKRNLERLSKQDYPLQIQERKQFKSDLERASVFAEKLLYVGPDADAICKVTKIIK